MTIYFPGYLKLLKSLSMGRGEEVMSSAYPHKGTLGFTDTVCIQGVLVGFK